MASHIKVYDATREYASLCIRHCVNILEATVSCTGFNNVNKNPFRHTFISKCFSGTTAPNAAEYLSSFVMARSGNNKHTTQRVVRNGQSIPGLHNKLLKPLAQGASRFEKLLARKKVTGPKKSVA